MAKIKYIDVILENVEYIRLYPQDILFVEIKDIKNDIIGYGTNMEVQDIYYSSEIKIIINKKANVISNVHTYGDESITPFERLLVCKDICALEIYYTNRTVKTIDVPYKGDEINELQVTQYNEDGDLFIEIHEEG